MKSPTLKKIRNTVPSFFEGITLFHEAYFHTWKGQLIVKVKRQKSKGYLAYLMDEINKTLIFVGIKKNLAAARKEISTAIKARNAMC